MPVEFSSTAVCADCSITLLRTKYLIYGTDMGFKRGKTPLPFLLDWGTSNGDGVSRSIRLHKWASVTQNLDRSDEYTCDPRVSWGGLAIQKSHR